MNTALATESTPVRGPRASLASVRGSLLIAFLLSCHEGKQGSDASPSTDGSTGELSTTDGPTAGGDSDVCSGSMPANGGPCAPFGVISAGVRHTCTLLFGGRIKCWGYNRFGEIGLANVNAVGDDETPDTVPLLDLGEAAIQVSGGLHHTCAVMANGRVYCWGSGSSNPKLVMLNGFAIQVVAGYEHTCTLRNDGSVLCWGRGQFGQLGTGNTSDVADDEALSSLAPIDLGGRAMQISSSANHTCAVLEDGGVTCWGHGEFGQLGRGSTDSIGDDETPGTVGPIDVGAAVTMVAAGASHTCVVTVLGEVRCWGSGGNGELGYGSIEYIGDDETPAEAGIVSLARPAVAIAAGGASTCALLDDGTINCWGFNFYGQLGYGTVSDIGAENVPSDFGAIEVGSTAVQVTVGAEHVCALLADNSIRCWGNASEGALGYGNTGDSTVPGARCYDEFSSLICELDPVCCIGDMPGEMPPPPVPYQ